ncbi:DUF397 domain-containing protein [Saccharopolyspora pogona]|uniref:DUF397 domain-containing protein n=1 Tax=Saccharopolyspora pogona TaxID=333966 RepID=UPI0016843EB1|nr:DUF397 domain-containing protein [Saccharopolyspora pogona]
MSTVPRPQFAERDFRKATRSEPDKQCVRVARRDGWVELRDDKAVFGAPDDHRLVFTAEEFDAFLAPIHRGGFEVILVSFVDDCGGVWTCGIRWSAQLFHGSWVGPLRAGWGRVIRLFRVGRGWCGTGGASRVGGASFPGGAV